MGDGLKLIKGKRHKSSSSLSGVPLEGRLSTRKLDIRASIPELEDQFALAEARCDDLQEKIDLVKVLKKKRKLKKRSATRVNDQMSAVDVPPTISVRTQPKKKVSQTATRHRRFDMAPNPVRGYLDPATVEQRRMIGQMHGYNQMLRPEQEAPGSKASRQGRSLPSSRAPMVRPDGDGGNIRKSSRMAAAAIQISTGSQDAGCGSDGGTAYSEADDIINQPTVCNIAAMAKNFDNSRFAKSPTTRRRHVPKETIVKDETKPTRGYRAESSPHLRKISNIQKQKDSPPSIPEERSVVELFNKSQFRDSLTTNERNTNSEELSARKKGRGAQNYSQSTDVNNASMAPIKKESSTKHPHRLKYRSRRYELPTVASQMKQARAQYYHGTANQTNIPFVVSKSTAPSHNIGVNIQQVLNGLKIQQPLSGIPLTIAHHMGLGHLPTYGRSRTTTMHPRLDNKEINAIQLGRKLVRLPSYKVNMSFNRLLTLYREGDGMVPRFLRAISRPHYFYTSMYNLATNRDDHDEATSKGHSGSQEAKQSLTEYAALYREYQYVEKCIKEGNQDPELEQMKVELSKELANREDHIRRVVQEYGTSQCDVDPSTLRASASTSENPYRHSTIRLNVGDPQL